MKKLMPQLVSENMQINGKKSTAIKPLSGTSHRINVRIDRFKVGMDLCNITSLIPTYNQHSEGNQY